MKFYSFDEQAYTHELENKVSWLEEENERLKRQKVGSANQNNSCMNSALICISSSDF